MFLKALHTVQQQSQTVYHQVFGITCNYVSSCSQSTELLRHSVSVGGSALFKAELY